jgi:hypothetical protein
VQAKEIASLLQHGNQELDNGHPSVALSMLFEAQFALNAMSQNAMEEAAELPSCLSSTSKMVNAMVQKAMEKTELPSCQSSTSTTVH